MTEKGIYLDLDTDNTLGGNNASDIYVPSQKAVKTYVDNNKGDTLPSQSGNSGKFLTTNGSTTSWATISASATWGGITGTLSDQTDLNTALNGKVSTSACAEVYPVIQKYQSGSSWYRIYSDGWCEMGGIFTASSSANAYDTVNFLKTFSNTNYFIVGSYIMSTIKQYSVAIQNKTTSSAQIYHNTESGSMQWYACGQLATGQY